MNYDFESLVADDISPVVWPVDEGFRIEGSYDAQKSTDVEYLNLYFEAKQTKYWIDRFPKLTKLRCLEMRKRSNQKTFEAICQLPRLERLKLGGSNIEDLSPIKNIKRLTHLYIGSSPKLDSFEPMAKLSNLVALGMQGTKAKPVDLEPITELVQLKGFLLSGPNYGIQLYDTLKPLGALENLLFFGISNTRASDRSLSFIERFRKLKYLHFYTMRDWPLTEYSRLYKAMPDVECEQLRLAVTDQGFRSEYGIK